MSSSGFRRPEFRLVFDQSNATLFERGRRVPLRTLSIGADGFEAGLREIGAALRRAGGRPTVVLPASEVWSEAADMAGSTRLGRWRAARRTAVRGLGRAPGALRIGVGAPETDGRRTIAAVPRRTLADTRAYLGSLGIEVGRFEAPGGYGPPIALPERGRAPTPRTIGVGGAVAAAGLALFLGTGGTPPESGAPAADRVEIAAPAAPPEAPAHEPTTALLTAEAPPPRPVRPVVEPPAAEPPAVESRRPTPPRAPAAAPARPDPAPVTKAARELPGLSDTMDARERIQPVAPKPRPDSAALQTLPDEAAVRLAALPRSSADVRPLHRPMIEPSAALPQPEAAAPASSIAASVAGPRPRPKPAEAPSAALSGAITDAVEAAQAAPATASLRPEPRRFAARTAAVATIAATRPVAVRPQPAVTAQPVRTAAVPVQAPVPQRQAAPTPTVQPATVRRSVPLRERIGLNRRQVSLIGVFGEAGGRYALVRLPNGKVHRVRPGDQVDGAQVAAIDRSSVQLAGRGSNVVLTMP